jgi:hypothetical protein
VQYPWYDGCLQEDANPGSTLGPGVEDLVQPELYTQADEQYVSLCYHGEIHTSCFARHGLGPPPRRPGDLPGEGPSGGFEKRAPAVAEVCWHAQVRIIRKGHGAAFLAIVVTATFS